MRLFGLDISRTKAAVGPSDLSAMDSRVSGNGWLSIQEPFTGAFQRNMEIDGASDLLAFSAVYACVSLIADDIAKLRPTLTQYQAKDDIWTELPVNQQSPKRAPLVKPNRYQTRVQFFSNWLTSKLLHGNTYVLKDRHNRGDVSDLYILDPRLVKPLVTESGDVYYQLSRDNMSGVTQNSGIVVPASEIIHDRMITPWHPLVGVSPVFACAMSGTQGRRIQNSSGKFFENMSRPSGQLTAPGPITDATAARLKSEFEQRFSGGNVGRMFVGGDGLHFEAITMPANDAQLIEQLKWTVEDVARCFHVPPHKIAGGPALALNNIGALNQDYYSETLQIHIEALEVLLDEGLELPANYHTEFDLSGLLRMDPLSQADANAKRLGSGELAPNEARRISNLPGVPGGDQPFMQQQMWQIGQLAKRSAPTDVPAAPMPAANEPPPQGAKSMETMHQAFDFVIRGLDELAVA
jgi:HK97 family phage portal protein